MDCEMIFILYIIPAVLVAVGIVTGIFEYIVIPHKDIFEGLKDWYNGDEEDFWW